MNMKTKTIGYWSITAIIVFAIGSGGVAELAHLSANVVGTVQILGYPLYFLNILGIWKVLGALVLLVPRFPRLKEWAYAGIFFDLTGAAASHAAVGDYGTHAFHIIVPLFLTAALGASWVLRPSSRSIGSLFPAKAARLVRERASTAMDGVAPGVVSLT